jgi:DNA-binding MarR family transcriptional regulator
MRRTNLKIVHSDLPSSDFQEGLRTELKLELTKKFINVIPRAMWAIRYGMRAAAEAEFSVPQFRVMASLSHESRTNSELAELIGMSVPAMSRLVDGLVGEGVITRVPQERDRRQISLVLSADGRRRFSKLRRSTQNLFNAKFSALSLEQRSKLAEGLAVLEVLFP